MDRYDLDEEEKPKLRLIDEGADDDLVPDVIAEEASAHDAVQRFLDGDVDFSGFTPAASQRAFRNVAYELVKIGKVFRREWFDESTQKHRKMRKVNETLWKHWCKEDPRFVGWFYSEFPDVEPVGEEEFRFLDRRFWEGLRDGMCDKREWAFKQYASVRFKNTKDPDAIVVDLNELRTFLGTGGGSKWKLPVSG